MNLLNPTTTTLFDFSPNANLNAWTILDDVVMGGRSAGNFELNATGHGHYHGSVSLENNGGFSSVRHSFPAKKVSPESRLILHLKGDGKKYQIRVKAKRQDYYSYVNYFKTNGEWQKISVQLKDLYPTFRGRKLQMPNFAGTAIESFSILISNKKAEDFTLLLDKIEIQNP